MTLKLESGTCLFASSSHFTTGQLIQEMGPNNPYPLGPTGVIKAGAYADLIIIDGNPLEDINLLTTPDETFDVIMKDGVIYKNEL